MPKDFFQDMVKVKRAQNAVKGRASAPMKEFVKKVEPKEEFEDEEDFEEKYVEPQESKSDFKKKLKSLEDTYEHKPQAARSSRGLWGLAVVAVLFLFFALSFVFAGANVTVNPRVKDLGLKNKSFSAVKDSISNDLPFDLIALSGQESLKVKGGASKEVSIKAEGEVIIYNNFSTAPQPLAIDTRLVASNDKIYKTKAKTTVPGMTKDGKPGTVKVGIYATEAGDSYNSGPLDFNLLGFKGTPKYDKFYARSQGDIKGGLVGMQSVVSEGEKTTAVDTLRSTLREKLLKNATETIPEGFVLLKDAVFLSIDEESTGDVSSDGMVSLTLKGTLYGFLFEEKKLTQKIVESNVEKYDGSEVFIPNLKDLAFDLDGQDSASFKDVTKITFNLSGSSKIIWKLDEAKLISDMLGKQKSEFTQVLSAYPNIVTAEVEFHPFWKRSFPDNAKKVKVNIVYPE